MKDLIILCLFFYSFAVFYKTDSLLALILYTFCVIFFIIKYFRQRWKLETIYVKNQKKTNCLREFFIDTINHDIKVPLLAQLRGAELLRNGISGEINDNQKEIIIQIENSCKYVLDMIAMYTNAHLLENKSYHLSYEKFNIKELLGYCFDELAQSARDKNITFTCSFPKERLFIKADKKEIKKVILNLLSGAICYSKNGGSVDVKLENKENSLKLSLSGMELLKNKSKNEKNFSTIGDALRIYLCKKIIEVHKGKFFYNDKLNTKIGFELPVQLTKF